MSDFEGKGWFGEEPQPYPDVVAPPPAAPPVAAGYSSPYGYQPPPVPPQRDTKVWWMVGIVAIVTLFVVGLTIAIASNDPDPDPVSAPRPDVERPRTTTTSTSTTTTTAPPTTAPPPPPAPPPAGFGGGTWLVGQDIQPGIYTTTPGFTCYWERRSDVGTDIDGVIVNANPQGQAIVEILASDVAFMTDRACGNWVAYAPPAAPIDRIEDGDWVVGEQVLPGTYVAENWSGLCYWEHADDFTHNLGDLIDNEFPDGGQPSPVTLRAGERFTTADCGTWVPG